MSPLDWSESASVSGTQALLLVDEAEVADNKDHRGLQLLLPLPLSPGSPQFPASFLQPQTRTQTPRATWSCHLPATHFRERLDLSFSEATGHERRKRGQEGELKKQTKNAVEVGELEMVP
jgi:hypothetical protein